jgi:hypothetical protein
MTLTARPHAPSFTRSQLFFEGAHAISIAFNERIDIDRVVGVGAPAVAVACG